MRRVLSSFVATLCLLCLFISSAACMVVPYGQSTMSTASPSSSISIGTQDHACCPSNGLANHASAVCCTVHHQQANVSSDNESNLSFVTAQALLPAAFHTVTAAEPRISKTASPPARRPPLALRI